GPCGVSFGVVLYEKVRRDYFVRQTAEHSQPLGLPEGGVASAAADFRLIYEAVKKRRRVPGAATLHHVLGHNPGSGHFDPWRPHAHGKHQSPPVTLGSWAQLSRYPTGGSRPRSRCDFARLVLMPAGP